MQNADPSQPDEKEVWITSNYGDSLDVVSIESKSNIIGSNQPGKNRQPS